ncbi:hypothetical protein C0991_012033 [Blastosporella zonata]|nr:hypothetical protein C0991_012033 [Blastosporella zonata]
MSIFTRPASPPPRQPSPELDYIPLPSPHIRSRVRTISSQDSPATPPGLAAPRPRRQILTVRSFNDLPYRTTRTTPPATPRSLPSPSRTHFTADYHHRRTLSNAIPYRSPPPSPTIASPPPPVPPIPAFALSAPPTLKHASQPYAILPVHLPDLDTLPVLSEAPRSHKQSSQNRPTSERSRAGGMTCFRFFSLRNSAKRRAPAPPSVA